MRFYETQHEVDDLLGKIDTARAIGRHLAQHLRGAGHDVSPALEGDIVEGLSTLPDDLDHDSDPLEGIDDDEDGADDQNNGDDEDDDEEGADPVSESRRRRKTIRL